MTIDYNALAQAMDTTWGRSSTPVTATFSVKLTQLSANRVLASYAAIVNFGTENEMIRMKRKYSDESVSIINEVVKVVKERYKDLSDATLKVKEVNSSDSLEVINYGVHNPKRTAYYRRKTVFEIA